MAIVMIVFWIAIGLLYLGVHFPYQEILIGLCALAIGVIQLVGLLQKK